MQKGQTYLAEIEFLHGQPTPFKTNKYKRKKDRANAKNPVLNEHDKKPANMRYLISLIIVGLLMSFDVYGHDIDWTGTAPTVLSLVAMAIAMIALIVLIILLAGPER